jgi:hypothetical protein
MSSTMKLDLRQLLLMCPSLSFIFVSVCAQGQCPQPAHGKVERFANVSYVESVRGPAGIELMLQEDGGKLSAILQDYEGQPTPRKTRLHGTLSGCVVALSGQSSRGVIEIDGHLTITAFEGKIRRQIGTQWFLQKIFLRRKLSDAPAVVPSVVRSIRPRWVLQLS